MKKNILISGGGGYLARSVRRIMGEKNYFYIIVDVADRMRADKNTLYIFADVSKGKILERGLKASLEGNKLKIDGVVNTPAWNNFKSLRDSNFEDIEKIINTKLIGYANVIKSVSPYLNKGASIVNICSVQAHATRDPGAMYAAANGGILSLTRAMAIELRETRVRVNAVSPGGFDSDIYKKSHPDWRVRVKRRQCLPVKDVSRVIQFLLSKESGGINGIEIVVDGGISALRASSLDF